MIDLRERAFLDLKLEGNRLLLGEDLTQVTPSVRTLEDARYSLYDRKAKGPEILYWMYRQVARLADLELLNELGLIYDVTIIRPGQVGSEYIKTVGHYHATKPGTRMAYPEVYEVLHGEATFLLQRRTDMPGKVDDVVVITAHPGDKVVMPPGYGHITINASDEYLVMADVVAAANTSDYGDIKRLQGGAYFHINAGSEAWVRNRKYTATPPLRRLAARNYKEFHLFSDVPMYYTLIDRPASFRFLTHPEECSFRF
ncbi:MAG: glucose-6-phosphate isomerase family protein [Bacillota bacterium]